jgi:hypothetical protein
MTTRSNAAVGPTVGTSVETPAQPAESTRTDEARRRPARVTMGPAVVPLVHFEMCTLSNGHVGVVTSQTVSKTQRLMA